MTPGHMLRLTLCALCLLLVSCIDGDEEVWIEKDGSGRIAATYQMPVDFMEELGGGDQVVSRIKKAVAEEPAIRLKSITHRVEAGRSVVHFSGEFDDFRVLATFPERHLANKEHPDQSTPEQVLLGDIDIALKGLVLSFDREVALAPLLPERVRNNPGLLGQSTFRYTLHLPVGSSDNDADEVTNRGRTLRWSFPLRNYTDRPMTYYAECVLPLPWWIWLTLSLIIVLFLLLIVWAVRYTMAVRGG